MLGAMRRWHRLGFFVLALAGLAGSTTRGDTHRGPWAMDRIHRNAGAAMAMLKNLSSAQSQCHAARWIDVDRNGVGEYGMLGELSGGVPLRGSGRRGDPPTLVAAFARVDDGVVVRGGYCVRVFLPGRDGLAVSERTHGGVEVEAIDAVHACSLWCAYAWPLVAGMTGDWVLFIDQSGNVLRAANEDGRYSGVLQGPDASAARCPHSDGNMAAPAVQNEVGCDGQVWVIWS